MRWPEPALRAVDMRASRRLPFLFRSCLRMLTPGFLHFHGLRQAAHSSALKSATVFADTAASRDRKSEAGGAAKKRYGCGEAGEAGTAANAPSKGFRA